MTLNGLANHEAATNGVSSNGSASVELYLQIDDGDLCSELAAYPEGEEREEFAISAMRIGVIALRQAQGRIDADRVRQEGERFVDNMRVALETHQQEVTGQIGICLKTYFDPEGGRFSERVKRLTEKDGDLERVIRAQVEGSDSGLAQTLSTHVGKDSPLMRTLDPEATTGLIQQLTQSTEATLVQQKEAILKEFSLDNGEGALTRLVTELKTKHGEVGDALDKRISEVTGEFSLDNEDSALSRLMQGVEKAQRQISSEFDLNEDGSALARMQKKLLEEIEKQNKANTDFQTEVKTALAEMKARKQESERGTQHGLVFEEAVFGFLSERSQGAADIAERTGNTTGLIKNNKKGDVVIELGSESASAGARIVVEAKEDASYNLRKALEEMEEARKNRGAGIGVFVFSKRTAPSGLEVFNRYGNDVVVIWDAEDAGSDVFLDAGLSVARALCARPKSISEEIDADFEALEKAILEIGRQAEGLDEITKSSETIRSSTDRVIERARIMKEGLSKQIDILNERADGLKEVMGKLA